MSFNPYGVEYFLYQCFRVFANEIIRNLHKKKPDVRDQAFHIQEFRNPRMKTNLTQHPCSGKCTDFKEEQCATCLLSFESQADFLSGDVVVLKELNLLLTTDLITLKRFDGKYWHTDHRIGRVSGLAIRTATVAELNAKRRLSQIEHSIAEVP
jgi:hypothetical protein